MDERIAPCQLQCFKIALNATSFRCLAMHPNAVGSRSYHTLLGLTRQPPPESILIYTGQQIKPGQLYSMDSDEGSISFSCFLDLVQTTRMLVSGKGYALCMVISLHIQDAKTLAIPGAPCGRSDMVRAVSSCATLSSLHVCCVPKAEAPSCVLPQKGSLAASGWELLAA